MYNQVCKSCLLMIVWPFPLSQAAFLLPGIIILPSRAVFWGWRQHCQGISEEGPGSPLSRSHLVTDRICCNRYPSSLAPRWVTWGLLILHLSFPMGLLQAVPVVASRLDKAPFIYCLPFFVWLPHLWLCFLNPPDKLPALKSCLGIIEGISTRLFP